MDVWRPCDAVESAVSWKVAIEQTSRPSALIFTRQNVRHEQRSNEQLENIARGAYVLQDCNGTPDVILMATGSEVSLAMLAAEQLNHAGTAARVVSMPCAEIFELQDAAYKESVLPKAVSARVAVEAGVTDFWYKYVGLSGQVVGIDCFGESAPAEVLFEHFGFTVDHVVEAAKKAL
jgi:transketolase